MAISQNRYVDIASGIAAAPAATRREMIARIITTNELVPVGGYLEFNNYAGVSAYFGSTSAEAKWANKYFGFISKSFKSPGKISYARYTPSATTAQVIGNGIKPDLDAIKAASGDNNFTVGETDYSVTTSSVTSFADVATAVNTAMSGSYCSYSNTYGAFVYSGDVAANISGDLADAMGLTASTSPVSSAAASAETPDAAIARIAEISDNFASFAFLDANTFTADNIRAVASWTEGQNFKYAFLFPCTAETYSEVAEIVAGYTSVWLQLVTANGQEEFMPASIAAATDYDGRNTTVNYMFQQFGGVTPTVTSNQAANLYDSKNINYYGQTQRAGRTLAFLQRGVMADGTDADVFFNEVWLKDALQTDLLNLLVGQAKVPANRDGEAMVRGAINGSIEQALANGTILPGKTLNDAQKVTIDMLTGITGSWDDVQTFGYTLQVTIALNPSTGDYEARYLLIYSKGDAIRKIEGSDVLI